MVNLNGIVSDRRAALVAMAAAATSVGANIQQSSGDVDDEQIATKIQDERTRTRSALNAASEQVVSERAGAVVTDHGFSSLQAVLDAAQAGDVVEIREVWTLSVPVIVSKAVTIRCARGGRVMTKTDVHAFTVSASGVAFERVTITGLDGIKPGTQAAIRGIGTVTAPLTGITVRQCTIIGFRKYGVEGEHWHGAFIEGNRIESIAYAGIMLTSPKGGTIAGNTIRNIIQPAGFVNSYGIAVTRNSAQTLTASPRASGVFITGNTVDGVPRWEGIDTHGGEDIVIRDNIVRNTNVGIALVPGVGSSGSDVYAPRRIKVLNNTVASTVTDGSRSAGIQLVGCVVDVNTVTQYADAVIQGNTVDGHGQHGTANTGAIFVQATIGTIITGNVITEAGLNAIHATHNNKTLTVDGNTAVDTWTNRLSYTSMLRVSSHHNTIRFGGNLAVRASRKATRVNVRGLFASSGLINVSIQWGDNDMSATAMPKVDAGLSFSRMSATRMAFSETAKPISRPSLRGNATDLASTRTLVNQIRTTLINYGLTT